jgi:hypothetical protein
MSDTLRCLRWDAEGDARLRALSPEDWEILADDVEQAAGLHLLARRLQRADVVPPAAIAARLRTHTMAVAARNLEGRAIFAAAVRAVGRPALLLKGVDLAERLYGNLGHRQMGDIDFLVHAADVTAYHEHLSAHGFRASTEPTAELVAASLDHHHFYTPTAGTNRLPFELHWRLSSARYDTGIGLDTIWSRALPHPGFAPDAWIMAPDDLFLYLCLHLKHHTFEAPLTHLWDLAELIEAPALALDWDAIWERARSWELTEAVRISLHLVTRTLGVSTGHISAWRPNAILVALLPDPLVLLGRHSRLIAFTDARLGRVLSRSASWRERGLALAVGLVPSRLEVRTRYGTPDQGIARDIGSYFKRYRTIWHGKWRFLFAWSTGKRGVRSPVDRIARLRNYLETRQG